LTFFTLPYTVILIIKQGWFFFNINTKNWFSEQIKKGCSDQIKNENTDIRGFIGLQAETWVNFPHSIPLINT
jgi:hypothetical protein